MRSYSAKINADGARALLAEMVKENRNPTQTTVERYAKDMLNGDWLNWGEPIVRRASDNKVMNGGNRLTGLLHAAKTFPGIEIEFQIAEGVPDEAFKVIDTGRLRSNRDALQMATAGKSSGKAAAIVTWVWKYENGNPLGAAGGRADTPTRTEFLARYLQDPDNFETSSSRGRDAQRRRIAPYNVVGTFHYLLKTHPDIGPDVTEDFFEKLLIGANMAPNHPILQLRNKMIARGFPRSVHGRLRAYTSGEQLYLFHRTFRAYQTDEDMTLMLPRVEVTNNTFPKIYVPGDDA